MRSIAVLLLLPVTACGHRESGSSVSDTLVIATPLDSDVLIPPLARQATGLQVVEQIFERLADPVPGRPHDFSARVASSWEWSGDSLSIAFTIDERARWHDGVPVTSADVAFTLAVYRHPLLYDYPERFADIDSVTTPDGSVAVFWFARRTPGQFPDAACEMFILPSHLFSAIPAERVPGSSLAFRPVGSGPFRFVRWVRDSIIEVARDPGHYRGRVPLSRVIWKVTDSHSAALESVVAGNADFVDHVRSTQTEMLGRNPDLRTVIYPAPEYTAVVFNLRERGSGVRPHPVLGERGVRLALAMAIGRDSAIRSFDSLSSAVQGAIPHTGAAVDSGQPQILFDPGRAARLLDSLGWRLASGADVRRKGATRLEFELVVPSMSRRRQDAAIAAREDLRRLGVNIIIEEADLSTFQARVAARDFDSYFGAWTSAPGAAQHHGPAEPSFEDGAAVWMFGLRNMALLHKRFLLPQSPAHDWWRSIREWSVDTAFRSGRGSGGKKP
jgi:peptide/nickel transport system substrate-binding protein